MKKKPGVPSRPRPESEPAPPVPPADSQPVSVRMMDEPAPFAEVMVAESITEDSMERLFQAAAAEILRLGARRVLVDMSNIKVDLSISDLNGLAKLIEGTLGGIVERMAMVLRPADNPAEKFFEPAMSNRGMPTYVALDRNDAVDWLTARHMRPR